MLQQSAKREDIKKQAVAYSWFFEVFKRVFLALINFYQKAISPLIGPRCRFFPSCSQYTKEAILRYGPWRGVLLGFKRICRCHPFCSGGYDPVP